MYEARDAGAPCTRHGGGGARQPLRPLPTKRAKRLEGVPRAVHMWEQGKHDRIKWGFGGDMEVELQAKSLRVEVEEQGSKVTNFSLILGEFTMCPLLSRLVVSRL